MLPLVERRQRPRLAVEQLRGVAALVGARGGRFWEQELCVVADLDARGGEDLEVLEGEGGEAQAVHDLRDEVLLGVDLGDGLLRGGCWGIGGDGGGIGGLPPGFEEAAALGLALPRQVKVGRLDL